MAVNGSKAMGGNECREGEASGHAAPSSTSAIDWRALSDQRLNRLVEVEHDCSLLRDRLGAMWTDYQELFRVTEDRLQRIREMERSMSTLDDRLQALVRESERMRAEFLGSRSWRVTRPLRVLSSWASRVAPTGVPGARHRLAGMVVRKISGLRRRLRSLLSSSHRG
jgi:hypothetical protein